MGWKKMPYWLKGGLILSIISIITIILLFILSPFLSQELNKFIFFPSYQIGEIIGNGYNDYLISICGTEDIFGSTDYYPAACWSLFHIFFMYLIFTILNTLIYFIIGSVIGYIYGIMESKKSSKKKR